MKHTISKATDAYIDAMKEIEVLWGKLTDAMLAVEAEEHPGATPGTTETYKADEDEMLEVFTPLQEHLKNVFAIRVTARVSSGHTEI